jgi:predicted dienelactone hydrolase
MNARLVTSPRTVLLLAALMLLPAAARAQCRTGDDALADERALAAFRADLDESCPCGDYDGSSRQARRDYEACASTVLARAQSGGDLSARCVATARDVVNGAVCGLHAVACAAVEGTSATCKVTSASACHSARGRRTLLPTLSTTTATRPTSPFTRDPSSRRACANEEFCSDVVEWTAGTCFDTRADGPYGVGFHDVRLVKPSANDPNEERVLNAVVWYPTTPGAGPIETGSRAVRDAALDASGGPYPVIMFSHGSCGFERQSLFLTPWLASWGFVVVAVPHPGNTLSEFPNCGTPSAQAKSAVERPRDIVFALDWILAQGSDPQSPFRGAVDPEHVAMTGHSFGGLTTYLTTAIDDRFTVAVSMAPATGQRSALTIPSLTLYGEIDSVVSLPGIFAAYDRSSAPKRLVGIEDAGHYAFSDGCFPAPECNPPVTLTQDEAHERVKRQILPFLKFWLAGDASWKPFLDTPPPPGVLSQVN